MSDILVTSTCRHVDLNNVSFNKKHTACISGDILLVEVVSIGYYKSIELRDGSVADINIGDKILVAQAFRYSSAEYLLHPGNKDVILGSMGGVVGKSVIKNKKINCDTRVKVIGYAYDNKNKVLNLKNFVVVDNNCCFKKKRCIVVLGSDMNVGKTTTAASLIKDFVYSQNKTVGYGKITGTARLKDLMMAEQNGAKKVLDFTDCGYASTYKLSEEKIKKIVQTIYNNLVKEEIDCVVLEIADGILQRETKMIIDMGILNFFESEIYFCAKEVMSVGEAKRILEKNNLSIKKISGIVTNSVVSVEEIKQHYYLKSIIKDD